MAKQNMSSEIIAQMMRLAKDLTASNSEAEVERLFLAFLKTTPFKNKVHAVGGYCRDQVLGKDAKDLDMVVEIHGGAEKFSKFLHNSFPQETSNAYEMGKGYPIWHIAFQKDITYKGELYKTDGAEIDIADTQKEAFPDPTTRQRVTTFGTLEEDCKRRDFTVNMIYKDLTSGEFKDLTGVSLKDIKEGVLQGHPEVDLNKIFADDPLRMIRLVRFQAKYNWHIPQSVLDTVKANAKRIEIVSVERIMDELKKLGKIPQGFYRAVKFMKETDLLPYVLPEVQALVNVPTPEQQKNEKRGVHAEGDIFNHTMEVLKNAKPTLEDQIAALLHDVGKPATMQIFDDKIMYRKHDDVGGEMAEAILRRLKFDSDTIDKVKHVITEHMRVHSLDKSNVKSLRRYIRDLGNELELALNLGEADGAGTFEEKDGKPVAYGHDKELYDKIKQLKQDGDTQEPTKKKPALNGGEVMQLLGLKPGPDVGKASDILFDLEDEFGSEKMKDKDFAKKMLLERWKAS